MMLQDLLPGTRLNRRYRLDAELGRGGMGTVYRAHDTLLERAVAVKVLTDPGLGTQGQARLLAEARSAAQLNHPNIVSIYDAGQAELPGSPDLAPFIVVELVEGPSLHDRPPASLAETLQIAVQVCAALEHAHAHGIVHRDLKPENVLLAPDGSAKLNDFGLARSMASRLTAEGSVAGTVFYLAPELALGQAFDGRADLYALGVMLYELATGELPFHADDPIAVISQHLHAPVVPPRARNPRLPAALDALIVRLLSKAPADRPGSAAEVRQALAALALGEPLPAALPEPGEELSLLDRIVRGRLVAREQELAQLRARWQRARSGEGQVLLISGEPGVGKTRLVRDLLTQVQISGAWALLGECYAEGGAPYAPFAQVLGGVFHDGAGPALDLPASLLADLAGLAPALRLQFPDLPPTLKLDPQSEQQRLFESMVALCQALCGRAPLLLVLEDAHWADSGSLALLRHLARRLRRHPALLVATYREVEIDGLRPFQDLLLDLNRERLATRLKLSRLDRQGTCDLLAALFAEEITPEFLEGIYRETEGNPFFVEEVCKALAESGQLAFVDGRWRRPEVMDELIIPQSVRAAIHARLVKLPPEVQETLSLAAILGREFDVDTLAAAAEVDEEALIAALETAERAQLIEEVKGRRELVYTFVHALIPTTLAEGVYALRRRRLHRRAAAAIERLRPADDEALAYHWAAAGDEDRALTYYMRAGDRAAAAYVNAEAERHYRAALDLAPDPAARAYLLAELGRVLARLGRPTEAIAVCQEAIGLYQEMADLGAVARLYARSARAAWYGGDTPRGLALCREGLAALAGAPDSPDLADLLQETARACHFNGLPDEAAQLCAQALAQAERFGDVRVQCEALTTMGVLRQPAVEQSVAALDRAIELAEPAGLLNQASRAHNNLAVTLFFQRGDARSARLHFLRAAELDRQRGAVTEELFCRANAAGTAVLLGDLVLAESELASLRPMLDTTPNSGPAALLIARADALLHRYRGELETAAEQLASVRDAAQAAGDLQVLGAVLQNLVDLLLELGREAEAQVALDGVLALSRRGLGGGFAARCQMVAHLAQRGQIEAARRLLAEAQAGRGDPPPLSVNGLSLARAQAALAAAEGRWAEAMAAFDALTSGLQRAGLRPLYAQALREWAAAHLARGHPGDDERARDLFRQAAAEFVAIGAPLYAERVREQETGSFLS